MCNSDDLANDLPVQVCNSDNLANDLPVQVCYSDDLAADVVVESVDTVSVDETVADPAARLHCLLDVTQHLTTSTFYIVISTIIIIYDIFYKFLSHSAVIEHNILAGSMSICKLLTENRINVLLTSTCTGKHTG